MNTSKSIGYSCQNAHKRQKGGGENDDVEQKTNSLKSIGFSSQNWQESNFKKIASLQGRVSATNVFARSRIIYNKYYYNRKALREKIFSSLELFPRE